MIYQLDQYHLLYLKPATCERRAIFSGNIFFSPLSFAPWRPVMLMYTKNIFCLFTGISARQFASHFLLIPAIERSPEGDVAHRLCLVQLCPYRLEDTPGKLICNNWIILVKIEDAGCWKWMHRWCFEGVWSLLYYLFSLLNSFIMEWLSWSTASYNSSCFPPMAESFSHLLVALWPLCSLISKKIILLASLHVWWIVRRQKAPVCINDAHKDPATQVAEKEFIYFHPLPLHHDSRGLMF